MESSAVLSPCGTYRYRLVRTIRTRGPLVALFGVNPSTADASTDDPTLRRLLGFGERLGWQGFVLGNKYAHRTPHVRDLRDAPDPIGPDNNAHTSSILAGVDFTIAMWGTLTKLPPHLRTRWRFVERAARRDGCPLLCWGSTADGHPRHPLYVPYDEGLSPWRTPPSFDK